MKTEKSITLTEKQMNSPYNDEPVYYCTNCLSLHIQIVGDPENDDSLCLKCNRTDVEKTTIRVWRELWKQKYGKYPEE